MRMPWRPLAAVCGNRRAALQPAPLQARIAMRMPWWSFADGFAPMRDAAELAGGAADIRRALEEHDEMRWVCRGGWQAACVF